MYLSKFCICNDFTIIKIGKIDKHVIAFKLLLYLADIE